MPNKDLATITDTGEFENISHEILRNQNHRYATISQTGINREGKTIPDPVDGITLIQNDKGEIIEAIATECTTTERKGLRTKLLKENNPKKGDVIKSIEKLKKHKLERPNIKLTLVLCVLNLNSKLYEDVKQKCEKEGVVVDIWGYSKLNDELENTSKGQIIRRNHFGIKPTLISDELIDEFIESNLKAYKREFDYFENTIEREVFRPLEDLIYTSSGLILLKGESGRGKTTLCIQLYEQLISDKQFCCRISPETVANSNDFQKAIDAEFREKYPQCDESLYEKLSLNQIFVIIDDLNRTSKPRAILDRIQSWFYGYEDVRQVPYTVICPIWNRNVALKRIEYEKTDFIKEIPLSLFSEDESQKFHTKNLKEVRDNDIANLGNDPYLLGLYAKSQKTDTSPDRLVEKSIENEIEVHSIKNNNFTSDYEESLSSLIYFQLVNRDLYTSTNTLKKWFKDDKDSFNIIQALATTNTLIYLSKDASNNETLYFRHDRIHEFFIKNTLQKILTGEGFDNPIIKNPYYAEYVGKVIAKSEISDSDIDLILELQPTIIFYALKEIGEPESDYHKLIGQKSIDWFADYVEGNSEGCAKYDSIIDIIYDTQSRVALELGMKLKENSRTKITILFKNGYWAGPIDYFFMFLDDEPKIGNSERDKIIIEYRTKYYEQSVRVIKKILTSKNTDVKVKRSALIFAGYLKSPHLEEVICEFFSNYDNKQEILVESIWAILNCYQTNLEDVIKPFFQYWTTLPNEHVHNEHMSLRTLIRWRLRFDNIDDENVTKLFISYLHNNKGLEREMLSFLYEIDSPLAVEEVIFDLSKNHREYLKNTERIPFHLMGANLRDSNFSTKYSKNTIARLRELWLNSEDEYVKFFAFEYWKKNVDKKNVHLLKEISRDSPLYKASLERRLHLGDRTVVDEIYDTLREKHFRNAQYIWCPELFSKIRNDLETNQDIKLVPCYSEYLLSIPKVDAEVLLCLYYRNKENSTLLFQYGLYVGTEKTKKISKDIFDLSEDKSILFKTISFRTFSNMDVDRKKNLSESKLNNLIPYLDYFSPEELNSLSDNCLHNKMTAWAKRNIRNRITLEDDVREIIDSMYEEIPQNISYDEEPILSDYFNSCRCKCDKYCRLNDSIENVIEGSCNEEEFRMMIIKFTKTNKDLERFKDIIEAFKLIGKRSDIPILEQNVKENFGDAVKDIIEDTRFAIEERSLV